MTFIHIRGLWELDEEIKLLENYLNIGKKWSEISRKIPGRNENSVKNKFNSIIKKTRKENKGIESENEFAQIALQKKLDLNEKSNFVNFNKKSIDKKRNSLINMVMNETNFNNTNSSANLNQFNSQNNLITFLCTKSFNNIF